MKFFLLMAGLLLLTAAQAQDPAYPAAPPAPQNIVQAEYFFDADPGFGNGTAIAVSPGVDVSGIGFTVNTTGLSIGTHRLFVRSRSAEGNWSLSAFQEFIVDFDAPYSVVPAPQNLLQLEYFIDTDPGFGNGSSVALTPAVDINNLAASINTTGLSNGSHRLFVRSRNNEGRWAITDFKEFLVDSDPAYSTNPAPQNITQIEYFVDNDPGFGSGTALSITPAVDINNLSAAVNTTGLSIGSHRLFMRSRSNEGRWAITAFRDFLVDLDPAYPTAPSAPQNIIQAEYFINADPGFGNGAPISITPGIDINNLGVAVNTAALLPGTTNVLYLRSRSNEGRWSITNLSTFVVDLVSDPAYPPAPPAPGNVIRAEYFFNTDPGFGNATGIALTPGVNISNLAFSANTAGLPNGNHQLFVRSLDDWSLTAWAGFLKGSALPLRFLSFAAYNQPQVVDLAWETADETNTSHFVVERSANAQSWQAIGRVASQNTAGTHRYNWQDASPLAAVSYYRLQQVDKDGNYRYSAVLQVNRAQGEVEIYPNPASAFLYLRLPPLTTAIVRMVDAAGRQVLQQLLQNPASLVQLPLRNLPSGIYTVMVSSGPKEWKQTFVKQ